MEKIRIIISIIFTMASVTIIKLIVIWIEAQIKEQFENHEKIIKIVNNFYPLLTIGFSILLAFTYPAIPLDKYSFVLNFILYCGGILLVYHWLFKTIVDRIIKYIQNKTL
jgi:hypothetical protein